MPLPVLPVALAAGAFALARNVSILPANQAHDDMLDNVEEGTSLGRNPNGDALSGSYRYKRIVKFGKSGPGFEVDASFLGRLSLKRTD